MPNYKQLTTSHPEYDPAYWRRCEALYAGGRKLLGDDAVMKEVFPKHNAEEDHVYNERRKRAFYIPYAGQIIDFIVANLSCDPITIEVEEEGAEAGQGKAPDGFWGEFVEDVSPPNGCTQSLAQLVVEQVRTALKKRRAWTLVDLPRAPTDAPAPTSQADQEKAGLLQAYACVLDPECVRDWEFDESGELLWVLLWNKSQRRVGIDGDRKTVTEVFTYYDRTHWERYTYVYPVDKPPKDDETPGKGEDGPLTFGRVPVLPLELPEGLWAMGKLEPIAVEHLNKRCALSWAELKSLFPIFTVNLAPSDSMNPSQDDPNRAKNQRMGQGRAFVLGKDDDVRYVGPDAAAYDVALKDLGELRDEMHRVLHAMAQSQTNSAAAMQRSAESKQVDQATLVVVLGALGMLVREHALGIIKLAELGRGDKPADWCARGAENFDEMTVSGAIEEAQGVDVVSVPSATFQAEYKFRFARRLLGEDADEELLEQIRKELQANITNESFQAIPPPPPGQDEPDGDEPPPDDKPPAKPPAKE